MRDTKFRAKKDDMHFEWVYGNLIYNYAAEPRIQHGRSDLFTTCVKGTEGQYTGLKDKNGKEIYEGDIIYRHDCVDGGGCMGYDRVYFNKHTLSWGFIAWNKNFTPFHKWRVDGSIDGGGVVSSNVFELIKCEVIGNIYENKDLLSQPPSAQPSEAPKGRK